VALERDMDAPAAPELQACIDCKVPAPITKTDYTLISKTHKWRLERRREHGMLVLEWRCPTCWQRHKAERPPR
jgi:hypothetical protein